MKQRQRIRKKAPEGAFLMARPAGHKGGKGGGGGRTPVEVRDSLHSTAYARVIDLLGEGEIYGPVHGMDNALRDVYLNGTPVANADGTLNFSGAAIDFRTGTQLQEPLPGFPAAESTIAVGAELKAAQHWTRLFANLQASAIRVTLGVEGLSKANTGNGDIGYRVEYAIDLSVDGAGYQEVLASAFDSKTIAAARARAGLEHPPAPHHAQCQQQHHRRPHLHRQRYRGHRRQAALSHVGRGRHQDQRLAVPEYPDARLSRARPHHPRAGQLRSGTAQLAASGTAPSSWPGPTTRPGSSTT